MKIEQYLATFGDYRLNVSFHWSGQDSETITLIRSKLEQELEDLTDIMKEKELQGFDLKEAKLTEKYLLDCMSLLEERNEEMERHAAIARGDPVPERKKKKTRGSDVGSCIIEFL
ncbi:hypothetical protein HK102_001756, partial [Quaeritorhiza haematococci]